MNKKIRIIIETSNSLPADYAKANNITVLPMAICDQEGNLYNDERSDKQKEWAYNAIETGEKVFTTSFINTGIMQEVVEKLLLEADLVIYISLSKGFSGQYNAALEVEKMFDGRFVVFDSGAVCTNMEIQNRWLIEYLKENDFNKQDIQNQIEEINRHVTTVFTTPLYQGLVNSGRIPQIVCKALKLIKLFPIIASEECNKKYGFIKKWVDVDKQLFKALDARFENPPRGKEIREMYIISSLLTKEAIAILKTNMAEHYQINESQIFVRSTPLVIFVVTLKNSFGISIYTNNLERIPLK